MFKEVRDNLTEWAIGLGFILMLLVAFGNIREKQDAFDLGLRFMRFGAAVAVFAI